MSSIMLEPPMPPLGGLPVAAIVAYIGPIAILQGSGWELCDGTVITDDASPLKGQRKPNLTAFEYLTGAANDAGVNSQTGSNDTAPHNHGGSTENDGEHQHHGSTTDTGIGGFDPAHCFQTRGPQCHNHGHPIQTSMDGASRHHHAIPVQAAVKNANMPLSLSVYWLIRVR